MILDPKWLRYYAVISSAVLFKIFLTCVGAWGGFQLDKIMGTKPLFFMIGIVAGLGIGLWWLLRVVDKTKVD